MKRKTHDAAPKTGATEKAAANKPKEDKEENRAAKAGAAEGGSAGCPDAAAAAADGADAPRRAGEVWMFSALEKEGGVPLLEWQGNFPAPLPTGDGKKDRGRAAIATYYYEMGRRADALARGRLLAAARDAYLAAADPYKRFRFPRLRFFCRFTVTQDGGGFFSVRRETVLLRGGQTLRRVVSGDVFESRHGRLCSLSYLRAAGLPLAGEKKEDGFYLRDGQIFFFGGSGD